jgi:hypothetical protein
LPAALVAALIAPGIAQAAQKPVGHFRIAIDTAARNADYSRTKTSTDIVVLQAYQAPLMKQLKAANPNLKALVYKNLTGMTERAPYGIISTGVSTEEADAQPELYLKNTSGNRFKLQYFDWMYAGDVGLPAYQQLWADNVLADITADGWDGVFMDDANASMEYHYDPARVAKYPTDAAWQEATESALRAITARLNARGKLVVPNFGFTKNYPLVIKSWMRITDGGSNEQFVKWGLTDAADSYDDPSVFETQLQAMKDAEANGKLYLAITKSAPGDKNAARYGYASALLGGNGNVHFAFHPDYTNQTWLSEFDYAIGTPAAGHTRDASGVYRRKFSNGLVLVNPTASAAPVEFGGAYTGSGLTNAHRTRLPARSSLVLVKAGPDAPFGKSRRARTSRRKAAASRKARAAARKAVASRKARAAARKVKLRASRR